MKSKPANVEGLLFKEAEAGYLAGYVAALYAKDEGKDTISSVGGEKIPPVDAYIAGYQAGREGGHPGDQDAQRLLAGLRRPGASARSSALNQIAEGSVVVFQVAGQCGLGALDAAKEKSVQGIGVDADQGYLGDHIMTSAQKKVDVAV